MTIVEHLEELRRRLLIGLAALAVASVLSFLFVEPLLTWLLRPVVAAGSRVVFLAPTEAFFVRVKVALLAGVFLSLPVMLYQLWLFVSVGLTETERRYALWLIPPAMALFVAGAAFALIVVVPVGVRFLLGYQVQGVLEPMISIGAYTSFLTWFVLAFGLVFEMPIVIVFLTKIGLVTPQALAAWRRYALGAILVAAAPLSPGGDIFSMLMLAVPAYLLYEVSIWIARLVASRPAAAVEQVEGR
ncbi:MAG: twin-arginine translocase subunit TatC [Armatimonadota bacterium]|nr:twin-arginine translocase subunit TatC [Armatimonadota bacterium]MDR7449068.1 twin-arginine translocase subunit TatC [Armatimonadota bacterium]MDR7459148.1 twin-arginine translocase subunit TatC [Armatimonadota bacterium]MDR7480420.1 twin-arginine translocase subunit TatC [Armatimonadota bacterium]MDR7489367.1 twin-arginine translocase subunit TatC [Armatimonadota bacterium]